MWAVKATGVPHDNHDKSICYLFIWKDVEIGIEETILASTLTAKYLPITDW